MAGPLHACPQWSTGPAGLGRSGVNLTQTLHPPPVRLPLSQARLTERPSTTQPSFEWGPGESLQSKMPSQPTFHTANTPCPGGTPTPLIFSLLGQAGGLAGFPAGDAPRGAAPSPRGLCSSPRAIPPSCSGRCPSQAWWAAGPRVDQTGAAGVGCAQRGHVCGRRSGGFPQKALCESLPREETGWRCWETQRGGGGFSGAAPAPSSACSVMSKVVTSIWEMF